MTDITNNRADVILAETEDGVPVAHFTFTGSRGRSSHPYQLSIREAARLLEELSVVVRRGRNQIRNDSLAAALEGSHVRLVLKAPLDGNPAEPYDDPFEGSRED
jgi:hypothetical protein